jgi:hypothetical protein
MDFSPNISTIVLNNLTLGRVYFIRVCAFTSVGLGPFSASIEITMDPVLLEGRHEHNGVTAEDGGGASQILKEVWFIILMGCLLFVFLLLLSIILYTRRNSHKTKKDHISSKWLNLPLFHYFVSLSLLVLLLVPGGRRRREI